MGGTSIESPKAPTVTSSMADYVKNYPALFNLMQQYMPQEAAMQVGLAQQYAEPMGQAYKTAQEAMYPQETAITNLLNQQIQQGMTGELPDWARQSYMDTMRGQLGENALAGVGADYMSRGLLEQQKSWQDYYRNLGLSVTGRQPISTAQVPQTTNQLGNYTPANVLSYNAANYGTAANIYGTQQQAASQGNPYFNSLMGVAGMGLGGWMSNPSGFFGG